MSKPPKRIHKMTLYNFDLDVVWYLLNGHVNIDAVHILYAGAKSDLLNFMGKQTLKLITEAIEKEEALGGRE